MVMPDGDSKITDDSSTQQKIIAKAVDKLDDPATLMNVIAGAVDRRNLNYSDKQGEELLYLLDTDAPYTGWTKLMHKNGQVSTWPKSRTASLMDLSFRGMKMEKRKERILREWIYGRRRTSWNKTDKRARGWIQTA